MKKILSHLFRIAVLAILLTATGLYTKPVTQALAATVITVNTEAFNGSTDNFCSLMEAISNANNNNWYYTDCLAGSGNDTIVFTDAVNTISLGNIPLPTITDPSGLTINGSGRVVLHGQYQQRLFRVSNAPLRLTNIHLYGAYVDGAGAAIFNSGGTVTVTNSVFYFNEATAGGGAIVNNSGSLIVGNSLFLENCSDSPTVIGGAVVVGGGTAIFINNTFNKNRAAAGGDLYAGSGTVTLVNNIFANSQGGGHCRIDNIVVAGHHNLFQDASTACGFVNGVNGNLVGVNPAFDANNTYGIALSRTSPAIDAGHDIVCSEVPVSLNGLMRPQGIRCDIGAYEYPQTLVQAHFYSSAVRDGHVKESKETSSVGGAKNNTATILAIGDDASNRQYRAIISFGTSSLPDDVVIQSATLWLKYAGKVGTLPFSTHGNLLADVKKGALGNNAALQMGDFQATASKNKVLVFTNTMADNWFSKSFNALDFPLINVTGLTQFRLRFAKDDNNDFGADYLKIISSDGDPLVGWPQLIIEYYVR
jgi:hypothetical protein